MSSQAYPLRRSGIYRNLPTFDPSIKNLTAVVCGATGISGFHAVRALLDSPDRWSTIYTVSRKPLSDAQLAFIPKDLHRRIKHVAVDFSASHESLADTLRDSIPSVDYLFYYTYIQPPLESGESAMDPAVAQKLVDANVPVLGAFLGALETAELAPKRFLLQTGGKNYGAHMGRARTPLVESDPQPRHLGPNFYYNLEDLVKSFCERHPGTGWNVIRPMGIVGSAESTWMNIFYSFGLYAAVQAHMGQPLKFGGDFASWLHETDHSTARLTGYLSEWAVLEDSCANEDFNAHDGGAISWERFFHELARWFGASGVVPPSEDDAEYRETLKLPGGEKAPLGYGPPVRMRATYKLAEWAERKEVQTAWEEIRKESKSLKPEAEIGPEVANGDYAYLSCGNVSMSKARRYGFSGFVDTLESVFEEYREMESFGLLPPMKVDAARPLV
ncbi:hypothetical protein F5X68DRAFT_198644 [Plectosphaerella plurivora]|uniref:PRISE-like Rossmann-fold domain-containing protein n=1 Tax=Plectosphaerella plurivora TaxID=936078 RepID=A0A9P9ACN9_9PEZI|nr:hypothetical protein F5X68DRAFT_198644 [Plectosphaerella plurivora]